MTITISPEHGYVILAASGTFLLNVWQMKKIGGKRKELGIAVSQGGFKDEALTYQFAEWKSVDLGGKNSGSKLHPEGGFFGT